MGVVSEAITRAQGVLSSVMQEVVDTNSYTPTARKRLPASEQLRRYYSMKPEHYDVLRKQYGNTAVNEYVAAMERIAREVL